MASDNKASYSIIGFTVLSGAVAIILTLIYLGGLKGHSDEVLMETYYDRPVGGLTKGSPVNLRGVKIGEVRKVSFLGTRDGVNVQMKEAGMICIQMAVNRNLLGFDKYDKEAFVIESLKNRVEAGVRATVVSNGITGLSRIELDFYEDASKDELKISWKSEGIYVPSRISLMDNFSTAATKVMNQINKMDISSVWSNINSTVEALSKASDSAWVAFETRRPDLDKIVNDLGEAAAAMKDTAQSLQQNPSLIVRERQMEALPETR